MMNKKLYLFPLIALLATTFLSAGLFKKKHKNRWSTLKKVTNKLNKQIRISHPDPQKAFNIAPGETKTVNFKVGAKKGPSISYVTYGTFGGVFNLTDAGGGSIKFAFDKNFLDKCEKEARKRESYCGASGTGALSKPKNKKVFSLIVGADPYAGVMALSKFFKLIP